METAAPPHDPFNERATYELVSPATVRACTAPPLPALAATSAYAPYGLTALPFGAVVATSWKTVCGVRVHGGCDASHGMVATAAA